MIVSATEFKTNFGRYLELAEQEEIVITRNGKRVARLSGAGRKRMDILGEITGIVPADVSLEQSRTERMRKYESRD